MSPRLRTLIDQVARPAEADAAVLRRFAAAGDPAAFAELVRRYGRLVWGQCRHLLASEADADDAFQATFLALAQSARTLRDASKLGPWLHGVAYRVCLNARRRAAHRRERERAAAAPEAARPVADAAWDAAFAAVHDELAGLPEPLRAAFVVCVLEGKGTTQAAEQLGLPASTLSARLGRAKQALFERLSARGLTAGLAAVGAVALGAAAVPAAVVGRACDLAAGGAAPANVLSLSHGVLGMAAMNAKRWVVAAVLGCGLAAGVGGVWQANAQDKPGKPDPNRVPDTSKAAEELDRLKKQLQAEETKLRDAEERLKQKALAEEKAKEKGNRPDGGGKPAEPKAPEFLYAGQGAGYAPTVDELEKAVREVEAKGYTFVGVVSMKGMPKAKDGEAVPTLVFRRAAGGGAAGGRVEFMGRVLTEKEAEEVERKVQAERRAQQEKALQTEIEKLTKQLAELRGQEPPVKR